MKEEEVDASSKQHWDDLRNGRKNEKRMRVEQQSPKQCAELSHSLKHYVEMTSVEMS